ncbi:MAG: hypothetical protein Kow0092_29020 [Deferrisomatales bacterium]
MRRRWIVLLTLALTATASARELPRYFQAVRPLGMGGAFTAVADDENALFYNPAGLDRVRQWSLGVVNPLVEVGEKGYDFYRDAQDTDFDQTPEVTDLLRAYMGERIHYRAAAFPHFVRHRFALGVLGQLNVNVEPHNVAFPEADVNAFGSVGAHLGLGWGFFEQKLRLGVTVKYVQAYRLEQVYTAADIASDTFDDQLEDDFKDGAGFGFDLGAMFTFPVPLRPTVAVAVQNVGDTDLGDAGELPQQVNLGVSASHAFDWLALTAAADWVDATAELGEDEDFFKRLHLGVEAALPRILTLRAGLYQGYASLGATVDLRLLRVDYATYAEELGSSAGDRADRRHVLQATLGW